MSTLTCFITIFVDDPNIFIAYAYEIVSLIKILLFIIFDIIDIKLFIFSV